jgi:Tol biopolymer transport system component/regulation of enolase protein 1 (concanavalin A-like superfamily)
MSNVGGIGPMLRTNKPRTLAALAVAFLAHLAAASPPDRPVGHFESHQDVGAPKLPGTADWNGATQEYTLTAAGTNMWDTRDEFHFAWRRLQGDFIVQARVEFIGDGVDLHRKAGIIVRKNLDADSPYVDAALHGGDGLTSLQWRRTEGAVTEQAPMQAASRADMIQLERKGDTYTLYAARFGEPFVKQQLADFELGDEVFAGLFLCSHNADVIEQAVFQNVRIIRPARDGFVPYRDYIGSQLELLDVATGNRHIVYSSRQPFEAPNWTADGTALMYNSSGRTEPWGRIFRFDLLSRQPALVDTGFAIRNNNDHVLSFDGTMLAISDQSTDAGESTIFTLPVAGGVPARITPLTPSYMHSWSPDGKFLLYTGGRNGEFDIYKIPSDGSGPEVRLTTARGVDDGPEYTADGKYIYFNSVRSGKMQIWRMTADGGNQERITNDEYNNWFPHISPDGKWIAMISYDDELDEIDPSDHPYYKRVYLRLMPVAGGAPEVIAYVYGGQGTLNVPSWSPDSKTVAFISNTDSH